MYKIAIFSSFPPVKSGISYYNDTLSRSLSKFYKITFFVDSGCKLKDDFLKYGEVYEVIDVNKTVEKLRNFDVVIYHFGNNPYHYYMYDVSLKVPGIVVLHDFVLHHLVAGMTLYNNKADLYLSKIERWYPEYLEKAKNIIESGFPPDYFKYPFNDEIVDGALCVVVHSNYAKGILEARFHKPIFVVPMLSLCDVDTIKLINGKCEKKYFEISCVGFITMMKRVHVVLSVFQKLSEKYKNVKLNLIGELNPEMNKLLDFIRQNGLEDAVKLTGFCPDDALNQYVLDSDVCVNLRYPSAGETSATLVMALANGIPSIVSKYQQFDEYPDDVVLKVPIDVNEKNVLYAYLEKLILDSEFRCELGNNAREYIQENQSLDVIVERYNQIIDYIINAFSRQRPVDLRCREKMESVFANEIKNILL